MYLSHNKARSNTKAATLDTIQAARTTDQARRSDPQATRQDDNGAALVTLPRTSRRPAPERLPRHPPQLVQVQRLRRYARYLATL